MIKFIGTEPTKGHPQDAGYDLYAAFDIEIGAQPTKVPTGTLVEIPDGYFGKIYDRSSMAARGIKVSGGVIDASYRGEIQVLLETSGLPELISKGERIAQIVFQPCLNAPLVRVERLEPTARGDGGFGSTGRF